MTSRSSSLEPRDRNVSIPPPEYPVKRKRHRSASLEPQSPKRRCDFEFDLIFTEYERAEVVEHICSGWTAISVVQPESDEAEDEEEDEEEIYYDSPANINTTPPPMLPRDASPEIPDSSIAISPITPPAVHPAALPSSSSGTLPTPPDLTSSPGQSTNPNDPESIDGLDLKALMAKDKLSSFTLAQEKKIILWMKANETRCITNHKDSFTQLLRDLKFIDAGHRREVESALNRKVGQKLHTLWTKLKKRGVVEDVDVNSGGEMDKYALKFAKYTETWLREDWDGSLEVPGSWLAETVEVDHEVNESTTDKEKPCIVLEQYPEQPPKHQKKKSPEVQVFQDPVIDVLGNIQVFWTENIEKEKAESEEKVKDVWTKEVIPQSDWNFAAVQAQHLDLDLSEKIVLAEPVDDLLDSEVEEEFDEDEEGVDYDDSIYAQPFAGETEPEHRYGFVCDEHEANFEFVAREPIYEQPSAGEIEQCGYGEHEENFEFVSEEQTTPPPPPNLQKSRERLQNGETRTEGETIELGDRDSDSELDADEGFEHGDVEFYEDFYANGEFDSENIDVDEAVDADLEHDADEEDNVEPQSSTTATVPTSDSEDPISPRQVLVVQQAAFQTAEAGIPYEIIPLTCSTYPKWKTQLYALLLIYDAWGVITGHICPPVGNSVSGGEEHNRASIERQLQADDYTKKKSICLGWMLLTMGQEVRIAVAAKGVEDPRLLWEMLRDEFEVLT